MDEGMKEVSKDEFYATVGPMNVHPQPQRHIVHWETPSRVLVGITYPGYLCEGPERYLLRA